MRLRHILMTCAALSIVPAVANGEPTPAASPTAASNHSMSPAELASVRKSVRRMIDQIDLSYEQFTLPNGLRVLVHTDRSAPIVHVGMWYDVGSKHEPAGRSGFAHLFEHLMFNGSENVPGDYLPKLLEVGAEVNGSTSQDRTNYYETVPTPALDRALFMESDRMGHLLGALSQSSLDEQRGVVQNEKRQGANAPTSVIGDMAREALYPKTHPYGHSVIGSMKDLNAANLDDVRAFFGAHYGPNNATLILAGDVDLATAQKMVTKYFADIPAGRRNVRPAAGPVMLPRTISQTATAPITAPIIVREWPVPGADNKDALVLDGVSEMMAGNDERPLPRRLVRELKLFTSINARNSTNAQAGEFHIGGQVRPGVDPKAAAAALDREIEQFLKQGTTEDALTQWVARYSYGQVRGLESVAARGSQLGENAMTHGDPLATKTNLRFYADLTPATVMAGARRWLDRPRWELTVTPGPRMTAADDAGMDGTPTPAAAVPTAVPSPVVEATSAAATTGRRGPLPAVGEATALDFPAIEHARLSNGITVLYARFGSVPFTSVNLEVPGGRLHEPADRAYAMSTMYDLLSKGFGTLDERQIKERKELLGLWLTTGASNERSVVALDAPDANLAPGLRMMQQMLTTPTFPADKVEDTKREKLDQLASMRLAPPVLIGQELLPLLDANSPYNRGSMYDDPAVIRGLDRDAVVAAYRRWVRPEGAKLTIVSDRPLAELMPLLNETIGSWKVGGQTAPLPPIPWQPQPGKPQIVLIDLPGAVQATIQGGQIVPTDDKAPNEALNIASNVLGSGFTSRLNMNLREDKHWTYGASANFDLRPYSSQYLFQATVQQDKTGAAIAEVMKDVGRTLSDEPISQIEFERAKAAMLGNAQTQYATRYGVHGALDDVSLRNRPDNYPGQFSARIRAVTLPAAMTALRSQLNPAKWVWVITGNAALIRPQLNMLGLPVRVIKAQDVLPPL